jgi:hypothetical protein
MTDLNIDELPNMSPKEIASSLFNHDPQNPSSIELIKYSEKYDPDVTSLNFEILLTIYIEGLMYILDAITNSENRTEKDVFRTITYDDLMFPNPWFNSFSHKIVVKEYNIREEGTNDNLNTNVRPFSYCRILLRFDDRSDWYFEQKGITEKYHFILNAGYKKTKNIDEIYALLSKGNSVYKIYFKENVARKIETFETL